VLDGCLMIILALYVIIGIPYIYNHDDEMFNVDMCELVVMTMMYSHDDMQELACRLISMRW
jgi:hypothetical protein